jgi:hypothetical protein
MAEMFATATGSLRCNTLAHSPWPTCVSPNVSFLCASLMLEVTGYNLVAETECSGIEICGLTIEVFVFCSLVGCFLVLVSVECHVTAQRFVDSCCVKARWKLGLLNTWKWGHRGLPKRRDPLTQRHGVTAQMTWILKWRNFKNGQMWSSERVSLS